MSIPKTRAVPCQPTGSEVGPSTARTTGPGRPGPTSYRAGPGQNVVPWAGPLCLGLHGHLYVEEGDVRHQVQILIFFLIYEKFNIYFYNICNS